MVNEGYPMKYKIFILMLAILLSFNFVHAEVTYWQDTLLLDSTGIVRYHAFYQFDDTSANAIGRQKDIPVEIFYNVNSLPYNLTYGTVDYCNLTLIHYKNIYGTNFVAFQGIVGGELLNTTITTQNVYFNSGSYSGTLTENLRDKDYMTVDMDCHYTDTRSLYEQNILVGSYTTFFPSFACDECSQYTVEELTNAVDNSDNQTAQEMLIYNSVGTIVNYNYQIWTILSWLIKIGFLIFSISLIFAGVFFIYKFLKEVGNDIR
jgi:hypothetical protein